MRKGDVFTKFSLVNSKAVEKFLYYVEPPAGTNKAALKSPLPANKADKANLLGKIYWTNVGKKASKETAKSLILGQITDLYLGKLSAAFPVKGSESPADDCCFSVRTPGRCLDLVADSPKARLAWFNGIRKLLGAVNIPVNIHNRAPSEDGAESKMDNMLDEYSPDVDSAGAVFTFGDPSTPEVLSRSSSVASGNVRRGVGGDDESRQSSRQSSAANSPRASRAEARAALGKGVGNAESMERAEAEMQRQIQQLEMLQSKLDDKINGDIEELRAAREMVEEGTMSPNRMDRDAEARIQDLKVCGDLWLSCVCVGVGVCGWVGVRVWVGVLFEYAA
jgi:hypothetical protein